MHKENETISSVGDVTLSEKPKNLNEGELEVYNYLKELFPEGAEVKEIAEKISKGQNLVENRLTSLKSKGLVIEIEIELGKWRIKD